MKREWATLCLAILLGCLGYSQETGAIEGFVGFADAFPPRKTVRVARDQEVCGHSKPNESFLVDADSRGLANAVVYWIPPSSSHTKKGEPAPIVLAQSQCRYEPHVQVGSVGAMLEIVNNDGILHNIHAYDGRDETLFNIAQPGVMKSMKRSLDDVSGVIKFKCDVHSWMNGYLLIFSDAIYAITDSTGRYALSGVSAGDQEIRIWHERLGEVTRSVQVDPSEPAVLDLVIEPNR
ncbi:MAG: carboxypeptidase regulatory-like domain-containing protein [Candidatus Neomarinimicrobiota bacterium]